MCGGVGRAGNGLVGGGAVGALTAWLSAGMLRCDRRNRPFITGGVLKRGVLGRDFVEPCLD